MVEPCICERGTCRQGKVTENPARQSQAPGFHPKPQLLPKDIKIFHILQNISEMLDLKRPLRFKLFQIFQHLQLSPPAETPGVVNLRPPGFQPESTGVSIRLKKNRKYRNGKDGKVISTYINICQRRRILSNLTLPKTDNENHQTTCHSDYKTHTAPVSPRFCPSSCSLCRASMVEPCICERGTCRQGKVTANPARQSQTPGFHPKPQLLPKDIKIFHALQIISEMPDLKRPSRFKLFQIFQHLQLSPPAETPGVVNLRPPGFQPGST